MNTRTRFQKVPQNNGYNVYVDGTFLCHLCRAEKKSWMIPLPNSASMGPYKNRRLAAQAYLNIFEHIPAAEADEERCRKLQDTPEYRKWREYCMWRSSPAVLEPYARKIAGILVDACGMPFEGAMYRSLVSALVEATTSNEFRFMGRLGFGGKLYYSCDGWRVSAYPEDTTPEIRRIVAATNLKLAELWITYGDALTKLVGTLVTPKVSGTSLGDHRDHTCMVTSALGDRITLDCKTCGVDIGTYATNQVHLLDVAENVAPNEQETK